MRMVLQKAVSAGMVLHEDISHAKTIHFSFNRTDRHNHFQKVQRLSAHSSNNELLFKKSFHDQLDLT